MHNASILVNANSVPLFVSTLRAVVLNLDLIFIYWATDTKHVQSFLEKS